MLREIVRIVAYRGTDDRIIAQGLECGTPHPGKTLDSALDAEIQSVVGLLHHAFRNGYNPFRGSSTPEKIWELLTPGTQPRKIHVQSITSEDGTRAYEAEIRCYDRTDVSIPVGELDD